MGSPRVVVGRRVTAKRRVNAFAGIPKRAAGSLDPAHLQAALHFGVVNWHSDGGAPKSPAFLPWERTGPA
ncbi:MAG: hypothetical protein ACYDEY_03390 [Acidimicrobiales bacterium]